MRGDESICVRLYALALISRIKLKVSFAKEPYKRDNIGSEEMSDIYGRLREEIRNSV